MGASNVMAAYALYAGKVPPTSMTLLAYMACISKDSDVQPWYGQGHAALAQGALGRPMPIQRADIKAVERAITPLLTAGAITATRRASIRRDGNHTVRYRLNLEFALIPRNVGDDNAPDIDESPVDNPDVDPQRPPKNGPHVPRNSGPRPPKNVPTSPGNRGTEEKEEEEERVEEEVLALRTDAGPSARASPCPHGVPPTIDCPACTRGLAAA